MIKVKKRHYGVSKDEIIKDLTRVARIYRKQTLTITEYEQYGMYSTCIMFKRFGGWVNMLNAAGLKTEYERNISIEKLFNNLEEVWLKAGKQPTRDMMRRPLSNYSGDTYVSRWGTWAKAMHAFDEYINSSSPKRKRKLEKLQMKLRPAKPRNPCVTLRYMVMKRDKFKCVLCGRTPARDPKAELVIDHIIPWSKGGETVYENLQTLCAECNGGKRDLIS